MFARPLPGTTKVAALLLIIVMVPSSIITAFVGQSAGMAFGLAFGVAMSVASTASNVVTIGYGALAAALAAASATAGNDAGAVALLMLASSAIMAIANRRSAGIMSLAPILVVLFGPGPIDLPWAGAAGWVLVGIAGGLLTTRVLKFEANPRPVAATIALHHAVVVGVLAAGSMYWALAAAVPHGYWVAVTVVVALRPLPAERADTVKGRLLGTLLGAAVALVAAITLPTWAAAAVAAICLYLLVVYAMGGSYFMQTLFLTPMLLLLASLGDDSLSIELTAQRVLFTIVGAGLVVLGAVILRWWDGRSVVPDELGESAPI